MSRVSAREGIANYFTAAQVPYVATVYPARPVIMEETAYTQTLLGRAVAQTDSGSSAVLVVNLPQTLRERRGLSGRGAVNDTEIHKVAVEIFFASTGGDGSQAQLDYDGIIDALIILIRSDPTFAGTLWSVAEQETSGIDHQQSEPYTDPDGPTIFIVGTLRFDAWEWAAGAAGTV